MLLDERYDDGRGGSSQSVVDERDGADALAVDVGESLVANDFHGADPLLM